MIENYFDNAATTPVHPAVLNEMLPCFNAEFGNANSLHDLGRRAAAAVELARNRVAELLGCAPEEVVFTSGATEANNWVLRQVTPAAVAVSPFEHNSVDETARALGCTFLSNHGGNLYPPTAECQLISVMSVNNETGAILNVPSAPGARCHRDVTQQLGKLPVDLDNVDYASMSAHKFHGPKGVGALYVRGGGPIEPLMYGGEHERGMRAGTLNVPAIVGFGAACAMAGERMDMDRSYAERLSEIVWEALSKLPDCRRNAHSANSPYILSVSCLGLEGETLVIEADAKGFSISSGAACSSRSTEPSHVLTALGMDKAWTRGTVRISFSRWNTPESAQALGRALAESIVTLRSMGN